MCPQAKTTPTTSLEFTEQDWEDASYALVGERADPPHCPQCGFTGFFGPRARDGGYRFRACRFCGFFQEVGKAPGRTIPVVHRCADWPVCGGADYLWWVEASAQWFTCPYCEQRAPVRGSNAFQRGVAVTAPADDPNHPWWTVPQDESYQYYYTYWEQWDCSRGRAVL